MSSPGLIPYEELISIAGDEGLPLSRVPEMRLKYGVNIITSPIRESVLRQYLRKYNDPIIRILILAVILSATVSTIRGGGLLDTIGIIVAIILSTLIAFINEYQSSRAFELLNAHRDDQAVKVIRSGRPVSVPAREVVVGDLVLLEAGDGIPADGWLISADTLYSDESAFTGETEPAGKGERDRLLKGALITAGKGSMIAGAVGDAAEMGVIASSLGIDHAAHTPLEQKLAALARIISLFGYAMAVLVFSTLVIRGVLIGEITGINLVTLDRLLHDVMLAVVIVVAAVPEGLPMSVALSLSLAMRRMARANCLVRRLVACETIGSATTICTDKTGTLTMNRMMVVVSSIERPVHPGEHPETPAAWLTLNAALNGTAHLEERENRVMVIGNSTEGALLRWLMEHSLDYRRIRETVALSRQNLFDGKRKRMSTIITSGGRRWLLVKGAPEVLASLCSTNPDLGGVQALASRAMRTLAFAHREITDDDESETRLIWDGYVGIRDHLRPGIAESIATCRRAGIRVRMVTGDNAETARAVAGEVGILQDGAVLTGDAFRALTPDEQVTAASDLDVMARAEPMDKLLLVSALQKTGAVVAVTGDGTNDAPALRHADVGLAMGIAGTEVAREASDIILLDDSFATIASAVWWGRSLYENIQRFVLFQLTINFCACIVIFIAPLLGYREPFTIVQVLWINLIMDTLAAFALCSEAPHAGLMDDPPISHDASIVTPFMWLSILVTGLFLIAGGLLQLSTGFLGGLTPEEIGTVFFVSFVFAALWNGINCRALDGRMPPFFRGNPTFFVVTVFIVAVQVAIVQYGGAFFATVPLSLEQWITAGLASASVLAVGFLLRFANRVHNVYLSPKRG